MKIGEIGSCLEVKQLGVWLIFFKSDENTAKEVGEITMQNSHKVHTKFAQCAD